MDIEGNITNIKQKKGFSLLSNHVEFTVINNGELIDVKAHFFLPIRKNDLIKGIIDDANVLTHLPRVFINKDKSNIISNIKLALFINHDKATAIYKRIKLADKHVYDYIMLLSENYHKTHDCDIINTIDDCDLAKLLKYWYKEFNLRQLYLLNITNHDIRHYHDNTIMMYQQCLKNVFAIYTIQMDKCYNIYKVFGADAPHNNDVECGKIIRFIYHFLIHKQWMCIPSSMVLKQFPMIKNHIDKLKNDYDVVFDLNCVYLKHIYDMEIHVATFIKTMIECDPIINMNDPLNQFYICKTGQEFIRYPVIKNDDMSKDQQVAIQAALDHKIVLITGMPGTGKTKTISEIVKNLDYRHLTYILTSFTGKSIDKLREVVLSSTNLATLHRLIYQAKKSITTTSYDVVIIDEVSMVTTELFYEFIKYYTMKQLILVGDKEQLPPIRYGSFLNELIKSKLVPTYYLTQNHRVINVSDDGILLNLYNMINADKAVFNFIETDNFNIIEGNIGTVCDIIRTCHDNHIGSDQITIISPYKKYLKELNEAYQFIYNKNSKSIVDKTGTIWKENDKVILCKNMTKKSIFNGQHGKLIKILSKSVIVDFGSISGCHEFTLESKYRYKSKCDDDDSEDDDNELTVSKLKHAYCLTTHKAQGSENDFIIVYIDSDYESSSFLNKNLLYTAISRAKMMVWIVTTSLKLIDDAVNTILPYRCENLALRLK
ncbi:MAG TPA: AAA family ATPase [Candidatus Saccharimonadales bacterium]|nr:AAA family ATPase [Candidatus Saccharimonadales bacterium]